MLDESVLGNRYTFQGREIDWSTGLYNFRARWYDAETGRWLSKDPIGINGGLNQYTFCGNNPVMFGDPSGLKIRENVVDTRIVNGVPQVLVQTLVWNVWGGINNSKPVGDPVWKNAGSKQERGYFVFDDDGCAKKSQYVYPHGALGQETKGMEHAANQMYATYAAGYAVGYAACFGIAYAPYGAVFYLTHAAEVNSVGLGLLSGGPEMSGSFWQDTGAILKSITDTLTGAL